MTAKLPKSQRLNTPNPANYSSPSVPISVYKQLANELNGAKNEVSALKSENQQLRNNNQQLQDQVLQVIQAGEHLKQMVNRYDFGADAYQLKDAEKADKPKELAPAFEMSQLPESVPAAANPMPRYVNPPMAVTAPQPPVAQKRSEARTPTKSPRSSKKSAPIATIAPPKHNSKDETESGGVNGWVIFIAAIAIICTAFGAGYMVVLPLLNNNNSTAQ
ncbi:MAG: hypothetical protein WBB82_11770 [Limnothrix sp.]